MELTTEGEERSISIRKTKAFFCGLWSFFYNQIRKHWKFASFHNFCLPSETRLVEIMEHLCKTKYLDDLNGFKDIKDIEFKVYELLPTVFRKYPFYLKRYFVFRKAKLGVTILQCQQLVEEHEESIENWYFHKQLSNPNLLKWLCFEKLRLCCDAGHFGADCKPCPGVDKGLPVCSGHGSCQVFIENLLSVLEKICI